MKYQSNGKPIDFTATVLISSETNVADLILIICLSRLKYQSAYPFFVAEVSTTGRFIGSPSGPKTVLAKKLAFAPI